MKVVIYIDSFFVMNVFMNLILLIALSKLVTDKTSYPRLFLASIIGALAACIVVIFPHMNTIVKYGILTIGASGCMIRISYPFKTLRHFIALLIKLYLVTFFLGGVLSWAYYNTDAGVLIGGLVYGTDRNRVGLTVILAGVMGMGFFIPVLKRFVLDIQQNLNKVYTVELIFEGKTLMVRGLMDTGNLLRDPISGRSVLIGQYDVVKAIIPEDIMSYTTRLRVIPYHSLGKNEGTLYGLIFDQVNIDVNGKKIITNDVIIALYQGRLSSKDDYQIILNDEIVRV